MNDCDSAERQFRLCFNFLMHGIPLSLFIKHALYIPLPLHFKIKFYICTIANYFRKLIYKLNRLSLMRCLMTAMPNLISTRSCIEISLMQTA